MSQTVSNCRVCGAATTPGRILCSDCSTRLDANLTWLERNLDDLENYRLNRANKPHTGGGGSSANAPSPMVERVYTFLAETIGYGDAGLEDELREFARSLGLEQVKPLSRQVGLIRRFGKLHSHGATPEYARIIDRMTRTAERLLSGDTGERVRYGACPGCGTQLEAQPADPNVVCPECHCSWTAKHLRARQVERALESDITGTQQRLLSLLASRGIYVNPNTLKSWIRRGTLPQAGEDECSKPVYRLADLARLATRYDIPNEGDNK